MKFIKKILHKYILKTRVHTVYLRGRLSDERQKLLEDNKNKKVFTLTKLSKILKKGDLGPIIEIGFGNGSHIIYLTKMYKDNLIVGIEMYREGLVKTLEKSIKEDAQNIMLIAEDARKVVDHLEHESVEQFYILFPDPWPKARHNKRRLLKKPFFEELIKKLKKGGEIVVATDWSQYAEEIEHALGEVENENLGKVETLEEERQVSITKTTFAVRAQKEGREIYIRKFVKLNK